MSESGLKTGRHRVFRGLLIAVLIILSAQGWFGDFVNIFQAPANGVPPPPLSVGGLSRAVTSLKPGVFLGFHAYTGLALVILGVSVLWLGFAWYSSRGVRVWSALGLASIISAAYGGYAFLHSGFTDGGGSAQMGGSFISSYACYFMTFYYTK